jgi:hypothetical protein
VFANLGQLLVEKLEQGVQTVRLAGADGNAPQALAGGLAFGRPNAVDFVEGSNLGDFVQI